MELAKLERQDCEKLQLAMRDGRIAFWYTKVQRGRRGFRVQLRRGDQDVFVPCGGVSQWLKDNRIES